LATVVLTATKWEQRPVRRALARMIARGDVRLMICGIGPRQEMDCCRLLGDMADVERLLLVGWAGGLHPDMGAGEAIVADCVLDEAGRRAPCSVPAVPGARVGPTLTVAEALLSPQAKRAARASGALAVEMEAYPLAAWAAARGIPFAHVRLISDGPNDNLPDFRPALDPSGRLRPLALLAHPRLAFDLARLSLRLLRLERRLGALARKAVSSMNQDRA